MSQELTRVIVTTDMEVDDMNSLIHLALYLNVLDVQAVVYTASQYHFLGDGAYTYLLDQQLPWKLVFFMIYCLMLYGLANVILRKRGS